MKLLLAALLLAASLPAQPVSKDAKIERLLVVMNAKAMTGQIFDQMKAMMAQQMPPAATAEQRAAAQEGQTKILDLIRAKMSWENMRPQYVKLYSETFSEAEIDGMLTFYESPAGRAVLEKMPVLMQKSMQLATAQMQDLMPQIQAIAGASGRK